MNDIVVISYPDKDPCFDSYFNNSRYHLSSILNERITLHGDHGEFSQNSLEIKIKSFDDNYGVVVYSHGTEDSILDSNKNPILNEYQAPHLSNSVVYSTACLNASYLGNKLIDNGCKLFFGYATKSYIPITDNDFYIESVFIETDNYALKLILEGEQDINKLIKKTDEYYESRYKEISKKYSYDAPFLMMNREAVRFLYK